MWVTGVLLRCFSQSRGIAKAEYYVETWQVLKTSQV